MVAPCSRCKAPVDRGTRYICYTLCEISYAAAQPGLAHCINDVTWAILCHPECGSLAREDNAQVGRQQSVVEVT
ncbi:MAG: hypothetical protein JWQ16_1408 [Novosphingobium sp.]|nr:hypothetical protein [Novosphingobium sp.]